MSKQVADVLDKARQRLIEKGWCQCRFEDLDGSCCLAGALNKFTGTPDTDPLWTAARAAIRKFTDDLSPMLWNDMKGRTKEEVLDVLERAANAERKKP